MTQPEQTLLLHRVVKIDRAVRSHHDRRRRCDRYTASYIGEDDGHEYRKSFEVPPGITFYPPETGTHATLNRRAYWLDGLDP